MEKGWEGGEGEGLRDGENWLDEAVEDLRSVPPILIGSEEINPSVWLPSVTYLCLLISLIC